MTKGRPDKLSGLLLVSLMEFLEELCWIEGDA